jgi:hypothetical protein
MFSKKYKNLDELLLFIEENIDLEHQKEVEKLHVKVNKFEPVPFLPLSILPGGGDFFQYDEASNLYPYQETFHDPEKMMYNELIKTVFTGSIYNSIQIKDYFPLQIRSNHGIGIIASMFGMKTKIFNNMLPYVISIQDKEEIKKIVKRGIPDFKAGLGKGVYDTHQFYHEKLKQYPKCARGIKITHPDMQGPFDIAHQIIGFDIFLMLHDERNLIHELLELITQTYIQCRKFIEDHYHLNDKADEEMIYIHGDICYGKVVIKDDTPQVSLSPTMYEEFSWQYNAKIFDEFKGTYHCCGSINDHIYKLLDQNKNVKGINYGNPENHNIKDIYKKNKGKKRSIYTWGWNQDYSFLKELLKDEEISTGITLACKVKDIEDGKRIIGEYLNEYACRI